MRGVQQSCEDTCATERVDMDELALSDSELCNTSHSEDIDATGHKPKMAPKPCHVRSHSVPQTKVPVRPNTLRLSAILGHLVTPNRSPLLKSPTTTILTVERSSLTLSKRSKTLLLSALLVLNFVAFVFVTSRVDYDHYPDEFRTRMLRYEDPDVWPSALAPRTERSYCPRRRLPEFSTGLGSENSMTKIAIVLAITSKARHGDGDRYELTRRNMVAAMPTFRSLLPSFCQTASVGYEYHFFFGYDVDDSSFTKAEFRRLFANTMLRMMTLYCPGGSAYVLHFVQCPYTRHVSWAQNDALMEAYLAGMDYFYRINDDTVMETPGWTEQFVWALSRFDPPNIGVVGPNHSGGNSRILTYEFVHRTHVEMMGYHYPRENGDWDDDVWITEIYRPARSLKIEHVRLRHTQELGRRYDVNTMSERVRRRVIREAKDKIERFIRQQKEKQVDQDPRKVISLSIQSTDSAHIWGAVRNAQLRRIVYPDWTLRVYVACDAPISGEHEEFASDVNRALRTLDALGADVRIVGDDVARTIPAPAWHLLALDEDDLDFVLLRNPEERLSDRDRRLVDAWMDGGNRTEYPVHCIRDHPSHVGHPIVHGLWAAMPASIRPLLGESLKSLLMNYAQNYTRHSMAFAQSFLTDVLWPAVGQQTICHDSVTCNRWNNTIRFDEVRGDVGYVGRKFNQHEEYMYPYDMLAFSQAGRSGCH